jgi:hypothetical protein
MSQQLNAQEILLFVRLAYQKTPLDEERSITRDSRHPLLSVDAEKT